MVTHQHPVRPRARRLAPDERRAAILATATELFTAHGQAFTTADLAEAAGVSEGTIFRYFPDKTSLVDAARERALGLDSLLVELALSATLGTPEARLLSAAHALETKLIQMARVMEETDTHDAPSPDHMVELLHALAGLFDGLPTDGVGSHDQLASVFVGMLVSNTVICAKSGTPPLATEQLVSLFLRGVQGA
ncbi:MAG: TetR/AcrR family transcriptional regulator [Microthrixaceae bacterium]